MSVTQEFIDAVTSKKMIRVRIMLKDSLLVDPTLIQFQEMERYANMNLSDLYMEHDGEVLKQDVGSWNEAYLDKEMVTVVNNFSKERVNLLKNMVRHIYKDRAEKMRSQTKSQQVKSPHITRKQVGAGVTTAGTMITVAGVCTSQAVMTIGGVAVVAAGVAIMISDKGN